MNEHRKANASELSQLSYRALSSFQKDDSSSFVNDPSLIKVRKPFSKSPVDNDSRSPVKDEEFFFKKKGLNKLDESEVTEKLVKEKKELARKVKELEERYSEIEGAKVFSKSFVSAIRSMEELIEDPETQCIFARLICLLHNNLKNFLESIEKIIKNLKNEINKHNEERMLLKTAHETERKEWQEKFKLEQAKLQSKSMKQNFNALKSKYNQMKINTERDKKETTNQIALLNMNNMMLTEKLKKLEADTNVLYTSQKIQQLSTDLQQAKGLLKDEVEDKSNIGFKLHTALEATKAELKEKDGALAITMSQYNKLLEAYNKAILELKNSRKEARKNEENMLMTYEDALQTKMKVAALRETLKEKDKMIEAENRNVKDLKIQLKLQKEGLILKDEVSMEGVLFDFVWDSPEAKQNNLRKHKAIDNQKNSLDINESKKEPVTSKDLNLQEARWDAIDIKKYSYLKPKYRALIGSLLPENEDKQLKYEPLFPVWLNIVTRAIFDSKFTEVLLSYNKGKRITRFIDFVYCWLGNFTIDKVTHEVKILEYTERETMARRNRLNLLVGLEATSNSKLWEIKVFKDFLEEEFGLDELVYFLHCRFILFKGPQLSIPTAGFCITHFISKDKVFDAIDRIMHAYSEEERKEFKRKLREFGKTSYKDSDAFDSAMILRVLLEFYRKEKKENFIKFEELYEATRKGIRIARPIFPFEEFYKVISETYNKDAAELEICNVYRESFVAGGGNITCDSILLTFSETSFWINHLRLKGQNTEPKYDSRGDIDTSDSRGKECAAIYK